MVLVKGAWPQKDVLGILFARHEGFRQRRALVRVVRFLSDHHDRIVIAFRAQRCGGLEPGLPGPDDDHGRPHYTWVSGSRTMRPASSCVTRIWQESRLFGRRGDTVQVSISSSVASIGSSRLRNVSST